MQWSRQNGPGQNRLALRLHVTHLTAASDALLPSEWMGTGDLPRFEDDMM
jgi:hypothetical protein